MTAALAWMSEKRTLLITFALNLVAISAFLLVRYIWDMELLDGMFDPDTISDHLRSLNVGQKRAHIWTTTTIDIIYPFAYGLFYAGMALRYLGKWGKYLAFFGLAAIPVDLVEGAVQIILLSQDTSHEFDMFITAKIALTWVKAVLFYTALFIALLTLPVMAKRCLYKWRGEANL